MQKDQNKILEFIKNDCLLYSSKYTVYMQRARITLLLFSEHSRAGMYNIWPVDQMWPAKAFNLARNAQIYVYLAWFLMETLKWLYKKLNQSGPQKFQQKNFGPPWNLSCASLL